MADANSPRLETLKERALQLDLNIKKADGSDFSEEELEKMVDQAAALAGNLTDEKREELKARANANEVTRQAREEGVGGQRSVSDNIYPTELTSNAPQQRGRRPRLERSEPSALDADLAKKAGLPAATDDDIALARHYGYPVVIPGAKAYRAEVEIRCAFSGKQRPAGSVILLTDAHAKNKLEYLTELDDEFHRPHHEEEPAPVQRTQAQGRHNQPARGNAKTVPAKPSRRS